MFSQFMKKGAPTHFAKPYKLGHDKMQHLLEARKGRGKSYCMAQWAVNAALEGIGTIANFHLDHDRIAYELVAAKRFLNLDAALEWCAVNIRFSNRWDDFLLAVDCLVLLDEINRLFDAQDRAKDDRVPKVVLEWLQQLRRNLVTLVCAAQSMDWLTTRIRQLFDLLWRAKKEMKSGKLRGEILCFWLYGSDPFGKGLSADVQRNADYKVRVPFTVKSSRRYNTLERIKAIPNVASWDTFEEVYQYQLRSGIVKPPTGRVRTPQCGSCFRQFGLRATMLDKKEGARPVAAGNAFGRIPQNRDCPASGLPQGTTDDKG